MMSISNKTYIGVTGDLEGRIWEHKEKIYPNSFTAKYNISKLVYIEEYSSINQAIEREKELKGWNRNKKLELIKEENPRLKDLYVEWNS